MQQVLGTGLSIIGIRQYLMAKLYTNESWLRKRFTMDKKSPQEIAKECGASVETIYVYLAKFNLRKSKR
jgi:hypothetical protein